MKFEELIFQPASCCGNHCSASADLLDGREITVYEQDGGLFTAAIIRNGLLVQPMQRDLTGGQVEALIA